MSKEDSKQWEKIQLQISELQGNIDRFRSEVQDRLGKLENGINSDFKGFENQLRESTRPDPHLWWGETLTIVTSNIYIALLVGSIPTREFERVLFGLMAMLFGIYFIRARWAIGRHIQAPRIFGRGIRIFYVMIIATGILTMIQGLLQLYGYG